MTDPERDLAAKVREGLENGRDVTLSEFETGRESHDRIVASWAEPIAALDSLLALTVRYRKERDTEFNTRMAQDKRFHELEHENADLLALTVKFREERDGAHKVLDTMGAPRTAYRPQGEDVGEYELSLAGRIAALAHDEGSPKREPVVLTPRHMAERCPTCGNPWEYPAAKLCADPFHAMVEVKPRDPE